MTTPINGMGPDEQRIAPAPKPPRRNPTFGKAALFSVLVLWAVFLLLSTTSIANWAGADLTRSVAGYGSFVAGITLSIISLVKGERRVLAIVTLCLVVVSPALFMMLAMLVWFAYSLSM